MVAIKFVYNNTVRRVDIEVTKRESTYPSLRKLHKVAREIFEDQGVVLPEELLLKYRDEEEDLITVTSKRELVEAFDCMIHKCNKIPKFFIFDKHPKKASQIAVETAQQAIQTFNSKAVQIQQCLQKEIRDLKLPSGEIIQKIPGALRETFEKVSDDAKKLANEVEKTVRDTVQKVNKKRVLLLAGMKKEPVVQPTEEEEEREPVRDEEEEPLLQHSDDNETPSVPEGEYDTLEEEESEEEEEETESELAASTTSTSSFKDEEVQQQKEEDPFELQLTQLEDMGFNDRVKNRQLLEQYTGDIVATIRDLLDHLDI
jgi:hypothetical protein